MRQKDGVALAMGQAVEAAKLMRHRVHVPQTGVVEGHPGKILGVGHAFTGFHVLAVGHGLAQVLGNQTDGLFRAGVRHRRGVGGNVRFDGVRQGVHTRGCGQGRRHTDHKDRVIDRDVGSQEPVHNGHLHMAFLIGDHAEARQFRSGARRRVDGDVVRQHVVDLIHAFILINRAAVGKQDAYALAAVVRGAAADGNQAVAAVGLILGDAFGHVFIGGIRHGLVIDAVRDVVAVQNVRNDLEDPRVHDALVGDDQRLGDMVGVDIMRDTVARAHADQGNARNKKTVHLARNRHVQSLPSKRDVKKKPRLDAPTGGAVSGATAAIRRHQGTLSA